MIKLPNYFILFSILSGALIFFFQLKILPPCDITSLLYDTALFLKGGTYIRDFFETNPPLIFIIYSPAIIFSQVLGFNLVTIFKLYTILIAGFSLLICAVLLKNRGYEKKYHFFLLSILLFIFLLLPFFDFGQREHFLIILIMPYLFSTVLRAENQSISTPFAVLIGVMAGLGFGLKPFFLPTYALLELYLLIKKRIFFRTEALVTALMLVTYLGFIEWLHPNYIHTLLPLVSKFYFVGNHQNWLIVLTNIVCLYFLMAVGYYIFFFPNIQKNEWIDITLIAAFGMILAFVLPQSAWWYHVFPALSLSCFAVAMMIYALSKTRALYFILLFCFFVPSAFFVTHGKHVLNIQRSLEYHPLTAYLRQLESKKMYCLITTTLCNTLAIATGQQFTGRFPIFWWVQGAQILADQDKMREVTLHQKKLFNQRGRVRFAERKTRFNHRKFQSIE